MDTVKAPHTMDYQKKETGVCVCVSAPASENKKIQVSTVS